MYRSFHLFCTYLSIMNLSIYEANLTLSLFSSHFLSHLILSYSTSHLISFSLSFPFFSSLHLLYRLLFSSPLNYSLLSSSLFPPVLYLGGVITGMILGAVAGAAVAACGAISCIWQVKFF